ncbi:MAG TPA: sigma 54-interacting transcriptional regulator, partial [Polyangia bacterium]|nr:sigma 54-interacting transcriptional regulator [Polyangia bacterium]
ALNLGALAAEAGRYELALEAGDRAVRELGRIGAAADLATALFNAGVLLIELGDLAGAGRIIGRLSEEPLLRSPATDGIARYLRAELATRRGDGLAALSELVPLAGAPGVNPAVRAAAQRARVDALARLGRQEDALALLSELEAAAPADPELRMCRAEVTLATTLGDADGMVALARSLQDDAGQAVAEGRRPRAWRTGLLAARLLDRAGQPADARRAFNDAHRWFEEVRMSTPIDHRPGLQQAPEARFFGAGFANPTVDAAAHARATRNEGRLRRLLRINKRLNSELRLPRLLELILDTVIELTEAERGFVLLEDDKGELVVKAARNIDQQSLEGQTLDLSRSIARQAATGSGPIVTIDAAGDPRFREALSVSDRHLRSVLAVPLLIKGRAAGTIYVDNRLRRGAFGDDDVQLVLDFSEQAAIAIENARLLGELRRRERQIETLNQRLERELAARKEELTGMKQELRENRGALAIRYDYRNIVGRTPRMMELFRLLDRLTDTSLPVVIQGESGTGKELVARALHFNGPRRQQPFVSENCAAIPETLLESTLFGAVRGAFTGADHDSRGLFEVADGGTLFLDEVGEMSPGMQGKLLRILQTGELRRVGAERTRKVDVRIIAATNRDLGRMVEEGRFRQDLFFRLSVARIQLPPLRERRDDIALVAEHFVAKQASKGSPPKVIDPGAMARLRAYRWPGNIRELENEISRAVALSPSDRIGVADLSPHIAGEGEAALTTLEDPDSLTLKPRVERLERALLREALTRSAGNQTKAAETLGLSRFGLQKKLRRYGMG